MIIFFAVIFGLIVGSFLNAWIHRLYSGESVVNDRSRCVHCHHELRTLDLIPVVSFVWLRGRCRYCGQKISWQYPLVEIVTAIIFVLVVTHYGLRIADFGLWFALIFAALLIVIGVFDFLHYLILDKIIYPAFVLAIIYRLVLHLSLLSGIYGVLVVSGFFGLQFLASRGRWIGLGDVKLGLFLGMVLGFEYSCVMLLLAYLLGALVGVILIASGRKHLGSRLPFGSFLSISAIITMLYGMALAGTYLRLIGL